MIREKIKEGAESAILALNPFYEIPSPEKANVSEIKSNLADKPFIEVIEEVKNAVFKANHFKNGYLSATEFFLYETEREIVNSKGVDVKSKGNPFRLALLRIRDRLAELQVFYLFHA